MRVAERAAGKGEGAHTVGKLAIGNGARRLCRVEGEDDVELAVGEQLLHGRIVLRIGLARAPHHRVKLVEIVEQRLGDRREIGLHHGFEKHRPVGDELGQDLLEEGRADEVRRLRIGEAARIGLRPVKQRLRGGRQGGCVGAGRIVEEDQLGHAPGAFQPLDLHGEIGADGRLVLDVDIAPVGQLLGPAGREEQTLPLHRGEVLAVDPDEVDGARVILAGRLLGDHGRHRAGGVLELHMHDLDAVPLAQLGAGPFDVGVDVFRTAPGVPVYGLAARLVEHGGPVGRLRFVGQRGERRRKQRGSPQQQ